MSFNVKTTGGDSLEAHYPLYGSLNVDSKNVISVQADGDELEAIYDICSNIPTSKSRVVRWYGDDAKFILV